MICLRLITRPGKHSNYEKLSIFDGKIKEDRDYWKKYHSVEARYFQLKEIL